MKTTIPGPDSSTKSCKIKERTLKEGQLRHEKLGARIKAAGSETTVPTNSGGMLWGAATSVGRGFGSLVASGVRAAGIVGIVEEMCVGKVEKRAKAQIERTELKKELEEEGVMVERVEENGGKEQSNIEGEEGWEVLDLKDDEKFGVIWLCLGVLMGHY